MQRSHVVEIPCFRPPERLARLFPHLLSSSSSACADLDDNDGLYLKGLYRAPGEPRRRKGSLVQDCTFAHGADDAIDINGTERGVVSCPVIIVI